MPEPSTPNPLWWQLQARVLVGIRKALDEPDGIDASPEAIDTACFVIAELAELWPHLSAAAGGAARPDVVISRLPA